MEEVEAAKIANGVISFMDELDEAMRTGVDTIQEFLRTKKFESTLAESGVVILYGDRLSNKAEDHEKFKVCFAGGHKDTIHLLLQEALIALEE